MLGFISHHKADTVPFVPVPLFICITATLNSFFGCHELLSDFSGENFWVQN